MDDDEDEVSNPWADGQCSRTSAYPRPGRGQLEVRKMSSFNISSLVRDTGAPGASQRPGVPVGVVTARQRVTTTTHTEIVTSLAPASASLTSAPGLAPSPFLAPHLAPHQPHLAPSLPQLGSNVPQLHPTAQLSAVPPPPGGLVSPLAHHALYPPPPSPYMFGFPDPHYYYFLQQQLLLLQHHQYLQAQVQTLPSLPSRAANINYLQSLENSVNSLKNPDPVKKLHDGIIADKLIHNTDIFNSLSSHAIQEEKKNEGGEEDDDGGEVREWFRHLDSNTLSAAHPAPVRGIKTNLASPWSYSSKVWWDSLPGEKISPGPRLRTYPLTSVSYEQFKRIDPFKNKELFDTEESESEVEEAPQPEKLVARSLSKEERARHYRALAALTSHLETVSQWGPERDCPGWQVSL